eukprot:g3072.t1
MQQCVSSVFRYGFRPSPSIIGRVRNAASVKHGLALDPMQSAANDRKTSIICTVGPATQSATGIRRLLDNGMNALRLNFSHGDHKQKRRIIADLRKSLQENIERGAENVDWSDGSNEQLCAVLADLKGPEIRTGSFGSSEDSSVRIETGSKVVLSTDPDLRNKCSASTIFVDFPSLHEELTEGQVIFVDDGLIELRVEESISEERAIVCRAVNGGLLGERKGINLPGASVSLPAVTEQDKLDLRFCVEERVEYVAASFVRCGSHVQEIRKILNEAADEFGVSQSIKIISKIENQEGIDNFDVILRESDGIMVARGDMGIEIPSEKVFLAQKMMLTKANVHRKLAICATQMLESMVTNPRPTRAEASDVANAVLDGSDVVMLSGETAKGKYPFEAVEIMSKICREAEMAIDNSTRFKQLEPEIRRENMRSTGMSRPTQSVAIGAAAVHLSNQCGASMIVILSQFDPILHENDASLYGQHEISRSVASLRPNAPIVYATDIANTRGASQIMMYRGVQPLLVPTETFRCATTLLEETFAMGKRMGVCQDGDQVVVISREDIDHPTDGRQRSGHLNALPTVRVVTVS